ncbi:MAG: chorismate synthase [Lachnospiraceae bacterium]|nr:chorismate synthase [Lachnospiraceae bacterium]
MAGSTYGTLFKVTTFGESHGPAIGAVVDGCPAGISLDEGFIQKYMDRRRPGTSRFTTARNEGDEVEILSGVFEGKTEGTPIALLIRNKDQHSRDYSELKDTYRPGHADFTFDEKYGFRDHRGGGRSSGRETAARVAAGAVALKLLSELGIEVHAYARKIGPFEVQGMITEYAEALNNPLGIPDRDTYEKASEFLDSAAGECDSFGGVIECTIKNLPMGLGEPVFDKYDAELSKAVMSIGAVKGFEIGDGFKAAKLKGSENNDPFRAENGRIIKETNHSGGTLGGMSDGSDIIFRAAVKPTPSIARPQKTVNREKEEKELVIKGRHDPLIVPRAIVVVECMAGIVTADMILRNMSSKMSDVKRIYK